MTIQERLKVFINYLNISEREFCRNIGVSPTYVQAMGSKVKRSTLDAMQRAYPLLNTQWLLNGAGDMLLTEPRVVEASPIDDKAENLPATDAMASRLLALVESQQQTIAQLTENNSRLTRLIEAYKKEPASPVVSAPAIAD